MCKIIKNKKPFKNLIDVMMHFSDNETCKNYLAEMRWSDGIICPHCTHDKVYTMKKNYKCAGCRKQFSVTKGTIFENSPIPLQKWFAAIWLITSHKKGIASLQLHRDISVTQKTAWFMLHRIRNCFGVETEQLDNTVEVDETYIGGKNKNRHESKKIKGTQGRSTKDKAAVLGMLERGDKVKAVKVPDVGTETLTTEIIENVKEGSTIYSDEWKSYKALNAIFEHSFVSHSAKEYVNGDVHTNTIEGFWSLLKRGIIGIYHFTSKKHLQKYLNAFAYRYNTRNLECSERFSNMLAISNVRLTYKQLIT